MSKISYFSFFCITLPVPPSRHPSGQLPTAVVQENWRGCIWRDVARLQGGILGGKGARSVGHVSRNLLNTTVAMSNKARLGDFWCQTSLNVCGFILLAPPPGLCLSLLKVDAHVALLSQVQLVGFHCPKSTPMRSLPERSFVRSPPTFFIQMHSVVWQYACFFSVCSLFLAQKQKFIVELPCKNTVSYIINSVERRYTSLRFLFVLCVYTFAIMLFILSVDNFFSSCLNSFFYRNSYFCQHNLSISFFKESWLVLFLILFII